ncbi:MAG: HIT family protein [Parvibaculaceae bacterium]|nr:HIT family protein [Parvibaculaceae bacterium]
MGFHLHERLAADTIHVGDLALSRVLLMNDRRFPWLILVPRREGLRDFDEVAAEDKVAFYREIEQASAALRALTGAHKLNVGALGNMVPQLHVHIVARFPADAAWPAPVWGYGVAEPCESGALEGLVAKLRRALDPESGD